jgi:hypothetical protein
MAFRILNVIGLSLALVSLSAFAQSTPGGSTPPPAVSGTATASGAAAPDGARQSGPRAAHAKSRHHARARHHTKAMHHRARHHARAQHHAMRHHERADARHAMRSDSRYQNDESGYQGALRRCVTGAPDQRDRCLNDAIARYGRS